MCFKASTRPAGSFMFPGVRCSRQETEDRKERVKLGPDGKNGREKMKRDSGQAVESGEEAGENRATETKSRVRCGKRRRWWTERRWGSAGGSRKKERGHKAGKDKRKVKGPGSDPTPSGGPTFPTKPLSPTRHSEEPLERHL